MSELIKYNGTTVFVGQQDPLVSKTTDYVQAGERWGTVENISLEGVITGTTFSNIYQAQTALFSKFNEDFKTLSITGFGDFPACRINNISFNESNYLSNASYSINLSSYGTGDSLLYTHGVTDPVNTISYTENDDMTVSATRTISAKGVNIHGKTNAVNNVINFLGLYTGESRRDGNVLESNDWVTAPFFIKNPVSADMPMLLISQNQSINRFTAVGSLTEEYVMDTTGDADFTQDFVLRYTESSRSSDKSREHITIQGSVDGSKYSQTKMSGAFKYYNRFKEGINGFIYNESLTQDAVNNSLNFSFEYDEGYNLDIVPVINVTVSENSDSSLISVNVNGTIEATSDEGANTATVINPGGAVSQRPMATLRRFYRVSKWWNLGNPDRKYAYPYEVARDAYEDYKSLHPTLGGSMRDSLVINPKPLTESVTEDREAGTISFSYSYDDRANRVGLGPTAGFPGTWDEDRLSADLVLNFKPMVEQITPVEGFLGIDYFDMGYHSLATFGMNLNIMGKDLTKGFPYMDSSLNSIIKRYCNPVGPLPAATFTQPKMKSLMTNSTQNKTVSVDILDSKGYSLSWDFVSKYKVTDHQDNGGEGGYIGTRSSFLV